METVNEVVEYLKDPFLVWRFQRFFGLRKIREVHNSTEEGSWVALDSRKVRAPLPERVKIPSPPTIDQSSFEREHLLNQRVTAVRNSSDNEEECSSGYSSEGDTEEEASILYYKIGNYFWYILFQLATGLGDETFCAPLFVFIILNIDGTVGRRVMLVWCSLMYIGQALKDRIRWPRPAMPPVIQLERKWALEYGMPSTHSMVGLGIPLSFFLFSSLSLPLHIPVVTTIVWCALVSTSRIYLGMHSVADILGGLALAVLLLPPLILVGHFDSGLVTWFYSPLVSLGLVILATTLYPSSGRWTPARGETTAMLGSYFGVQISFWLHYQVGLLTATDGLDDTQHAIELNISHTIVRTVLGGLIGGLAKTFSRPVWLRLSCYLVGINHLLYDKSRHLFVELFCKFWSYASLGFAVVFLSPLLFFILGVQRDAFFTELPV